MNYIGKRISLPKSPKEPRRILCWVCYRSLKLSLQHKGQRYRQQWQQKSADPANVQPVCIDASNFPRGGDGGGDRAAQLLVPNQYRDFFLSFITRPYNVKHCWRYNLELVDSELVKSWNSVNRNGANDRDGEIPVFPALQDVNRDMGPKMLIHYLQRREKRWRESQLGNHFAKTNQLTYSQPSLQLDPGSVIVGRGGQRASRFAEYK